MKIHGICTRQLLCAAVVAAVCGASSLAVAQDVTKKDVDDLKRDIADLKASLQQINTSLAGLGGIADATDSLTRRVDALEERMGEMASTAAAPSILGNMQKNPNFRQEMGKVIQGKIVVTNTTGYDQYVHINGVRWRAPAGMSYTYVPYGTVQTQLNPGEPVREWTVDDWQFVDNGHQLGIGIQW
jgi:hypothetical protein